MKLLNSRRMSVRNLLESGAVVWAVVLVVFAYAFLKSDDFRSVDNLANLARQFSVLALVALAQMLVVLAGGVDLSIAANVRLGAIVAAIVIAGENANLVWGILAAVGVGLGVGAFNALVAARFRVEPFITTLGTGALVGGLSLYIASTPKGRSAPALTDFYDFRIGPVYAVVILTAVIWLLAGYALTRMAWGRHVYAVGGDPAVARLSGIKVGHVQAGTYLAAGALGGVAALLTLASAGVGDPASATGLEFDSLAVVVIGGASLAGGRGRLVGVLGGVILFSILGNVFNLLQIDIWYQQLTRGLIILLAASLVVDRVRRRPTSPPRTAQPVPAA